MRQAEQDGEHIWLRQSVTFTTNGQTRTVEMGIPLRPGAPAEEIERLLNEAELGMWRISQRLDSHVAALLNGADSTAPTSHVAPAASTPSAPTPSAPATSATSAAASPSTEAPGQPAPTAPAAPASISVPAAPRPAAPSERPAPAAPPARTAAPTPAATNPPSHPTAAAPVAPAARSRPSGPLAAPAPAPAAPQTAGELSRKDFLAAARDMGLNDARQVMERLGVRTLEGLNLREALEALRRQMLRGDETAPATPASAASVAPVSSGPTTSNTSKSAIPAPATPRYFEEEDDVVFTVDGDDALSEEFGDYEAAGISNGAPPEGADGLEDLDALSDLDLDDVPDFGPPPSAAHASHTAHAAPTPARRSAPAKAAPTPPSAPATPSAEEQEPAPPASPAARRIAELRAVRGGGAPGTYQRTAYRNVVVNELGEEAANLVRGIWRVNPERLGPDQLDALISWGKQDTFAEEAAEVLAALRAERQQAQAAASEGAPASTASTSTTAAPSRPAPRGRSPQPPRASAGGR